MGILAFAVFHNVLQQKKHTSYQWVEGTVLAIITQSKSKHCKQCHLLCGSGSSVNGDRLCQWKPLIFNPNKFDLPYPVTKKIVTHD